MMERAGPASHHGPVNYIGYKCSWEPERLRLSSVKLFRECWKRLSVENQLGRETNPMIFNAGNLVREFKSTQ